MNQLQLSISIAERNVARPNVQQINSEFFKRRQNLFDPPPASFELLALVGLPIRPDIRRKFWANVEMGAGEIKHEGPLDDRHFDDAQLIIAADELRHIQSHNCLNSFLSETQIDSFLPLVSLSLFKDFDGAFSGFVLALGYQYNTVLSRTWRF